MNRLPDLAVLMNGSKAALLSSDSRGSLSLRYDGAYMDAPDAVPLSLAMPFTDRPHPHRTTERWAQSLLPDNPRVLSRWYDREDVQQRTPFGLLSTGAGFDCAGAVQFCPVGSENRLAARASGIQALASEAIERELGAIVGEPDAWHTDDLEPYFSLAGFQSKIALHRTDDGWGRPYGSVPTTHILKPRAHAGRTVAIGEHLCLDAARRLGLNAAASSLEQHGDVSALVVERYDRKRIDGHWTRVHQEDMCQALGVDGNRKYEHSGGPGMSQIGDLIWAHSTSPDEDIRRFADALIYSWLVINRDGHARNFSIVHAADAVRLAPTYDVNSSLMFKRETLGEANMAMRYGTTFTVCSAGSKQALPNMAARLRLPAGEIVSRAERLASGLPAAMSASVSELRACTDAAEEIDDFLRRVTRRSNGCLKTVSAARKHVRKERAARQAQQQPQTQRLFG